MPGGSEAGRPRWRRIVTTWRSGLWRRRWLVAAVVLLALVRANLPWILRHVVAAQASQFLQADVTLGDVDLALYKGGVVLEGLAIGLRPPVAENADPKPPAPPILAWKSLAVSLRWLPLVRQTIQLREVVLDTPEIRVERLQSGEFNFDALVRAAMAPAADGAPASPTPEPTPPSEEAASGWLMGIDRVVVSSGQLHFHDKAMGESEPIDVAIPTIEVRDVSMSPEVYGQPSESRLRLLLEEGSIEVGARAAMSGEDVSLESELVVRSLPLRHSRLYVPDVGWSELSGALDADLAYTLETGKVDEIRGTVSLRDLAVRVSDLPREALVLKQLSVRVDPIDLHNRAATVAEVSLDGLWVAARPSHPILLPLLAAGEQAAAAEPEATVDDEKRGDETADTAAPASPAEAAAAAPAAAWTWAVKAVRIADSGVHLLGPDREIDVHIGGQAADLAPGAEIRAPLDLTFRIGESSVRIEGAARVEPPGFAGALRIDDLQVPELIEVSGGLPENPLKALQLSTDLRIEAGMAAADAPPLALADVRVSGTVGVAGAQVASGGTEAAVAAADLQIEGLSLAGAIPGPPAEPLAAFSEGKGWVSFNGGLSVRELDARLADLGDFRVRLASLGLDETEVAAAGVLPPPAGEAPAPGAGDVRARTRLALGEPRLALGEGDDFLVTLRSLTLALSDLDLPGVLATPPAAAKPMRVAIGDLKIDRPRAKVTLTAGGVVLPGAAAPAGEAAAGAAPVPPATPSAAPEAQRAAPAAADVQVALDALSVKDGRVTFVDRTLTPALTSEVDDIDLRGRTLRFPQLTAGEVQIALETPEHGEIEVSGTLTAQGGKLRLDAREVALTPYNPYVAAFSPYQLTTGALSIATTATSSGRRYGAKNAITLHDLDVESAADGEGFIESQLGMPVASILALLRDPAGNITLDVPLQVAEGGASVDVMAVVGQALKAALIGAITSPLKLIGSIAGGDKVGTFTPRPIAFHPGGAGLTPEGAKVTDGLASLMQSRPGVGVELEAFVTGGDARALREQALLRTWADEGFFDGLLALGQGGTRSRVRAAVEDRARGGAGELSADDAAQLDEWLLDVPETKPDQLTALGARRLAAVAEALRGKEIADTRFVQREPRVETEGQPVVKLRLRPVAKAGVKENAASSS